MIKKENKGIQQNMKGRRVVLSAIAFIGVLIFCRLAQYPLIIPFFLFFLGLQLYWANKDKANLKMFLNLGLLLSLITFTAYVVDFYTSVSSFFIPVAGIAMLTMLLFNDLWLTLVMSLATSLVISLVLNGNFAMMIIFFIGSLTGAFSVREARTRGRLISAGLYVSLVHLICLVLLNPDIRLFLNREFTQYYVYPLLANGFISAFVVIATLKIFEFLFDAISNFTLLELADFNQPLLKRMILEAPGTYHHSLVVSNISETAADTIGANALLTRVGSYYHDIGKMVKSEYFTENQLLGGNKHDNIEPSMSRLVILNHVKEGMELAKKYKLNQAIINFIPQHHGTSLMHYFYQKAVEEVQEGEVVDENDYRYPGPKPQTRETAITLLADSVEGATRALDEPNPQNIEETVKKVINNKFIDGQLDECPLTLNEIEKISSAFIRILNAMYHTRVKYPEKKNGLTRNERSIPKDGSGYRRSAEDSSS